MASKECLRDATQSIENNPIVIGFYALIKRLEKQPDLDQYMAADIIMTAILEGKPLTQKQLQEIEEFIKI